MILKRGDGLGKENLFLRETLFELDARKRPYRLINSVAPIRICDNGGWTDTWFAEHGKIFNIAVAPCAEVQMIVRPRKNDKQVSIYAENYDEQYTPGLQNGVWERHPLLEATLARMGIPENVSIALSIHSQAPAGASTGTSAAVTVALIGALDCLTPGRMAPHEVAYLAQSIETEMLNQQCGIQDQLCAAYGGINFIEMFRYPHASVSPVKIPRSIWQELERRLLLIYLGKSHNSSQVHEQVIQNLEDLGPGSKQLQALRATAVPSRDALYAGDFAALGKAMQQNTDAQRALHSALISSEADQVIEIARAHGALGWKVNGAGGEGGSVTLLCGPLRYQRRVLVAAIEAENALVKHIPIRLSQHGLLVWETY